GQGHDVGHRLMIGHQDERGPGSDFFPALDTQPAARQAAQVQPRPPARIAMQERTMAVEGGRQQAQQHRPQVEKDRRACEEKPVTERESNSHHNGWRHLSLLRRHPYSSLKRSKSLSYSSSSWRTLAANSSSLSRTADTPSSHSVLALRSGARSS